MPDSDGLANSRIPLLETKLYLPKWRSGFISRSRLIDRLDQGFERKLTLVSAPAGFGKSTLLTEWLSSASESGRPSAWISLDQGDNDQNLFWSYFIAALQKIQPEIGEKALGQLNSPQAPPIESLLSGLINEISGIMSDFILILDDYHYIEAQPIHGALTFFVDHIPTQMTLVIAGRSDPLLPLSRLRARGELVELRASDLSFTASEASDFLNQSMSLNLSASDVEALDTRTEGWIAGLQLAALSIQGRDDVSEFIDAFAGDDRYIVDYLVEEVLNRQPENIRNFLLQTSALHRLSGSLCDAVTGGKDGKAVLDSLERANLFVVPLDDKRQWYRYHHLFADVLQARSIEERPDQVTEQHLRASEWFDQNSLPADAIRHALVAENFERAAAMIELAWPAMNGNFQSNTWIRWAREIPESLINARPVLGTAYAWALLDTGEIEAAGSWLKTADHWVSTTQASDERPIEMVVADEVQFETLPASISTARAYIAMTFGDVAGTESHAKRALELLPETAHSKLGAPAALLGLGYWNQGKLEAAYKYLDASMASFEKAGDIVFALSGAYGLADIRKAQGRLGDAIVTYKRFLRLSTDQTGPTIRGTADLYLGLAGLYQERGDTAAASLNMSKSEELGEQLALPDWPYRVCIAKALAEFAAGNLETTIELLDEADRLYFRSPVPALRPIAAIKARVSIELGRLTEAKHWATEQGISTDDELNFLREFEHLTLSRVLIAQYKGDRAGSSTIRNAMDLLERLLQAAKDGGRMDSVIEILIQQAIGHAAQNDTEVALNSLEQALELAEPEGYVRIFVDEGESMHNLLRHAAAKGVGGEYTRQLLGNFGDDAPEQSPETSADVAQLAEPLTVRELEILRLVAAAMRNQEIADHLFISIGTVKRHIANTYAKLEVGHRTEAVARAGELNLL